MRMVIVALVEESISTCEFARRNVDRKSDITVTIKLTEHVMRLSRAVANASLSRSSTFARACTHKPTAKCWLGCAAQRPLLGVKRTCRGLVSMSANDPKRTTREARQSEPEGCLDIAGVLLDQVT
jgi:hypothetical protein